MRLIEKVYIDGMDYSLLDIPEKEHYGPNGEPKTWWVYFNSSDENDMPTDINDPDLVPYNYSMKRRVWKVEIEEKNTSKYKWDSTHFRSSTWVRLWCNGRVVYGFGVNGFEYAMSKAQSLMVELQEFTGYNFFDPHENDGKAITYLGLPARIKVCSYPWEICIKPDYEKLEASKWFEKYFEIRSLLDKDYKKDEFYNYYMSVKDDKKALAGITSVSSGNVLEIKYVDFFPDVDIDDDNL